MIIVQKNRQDFFCCVYFFVSTSTIIWFDILLFKSKRERENMETALLSYSLWTKLLI